jgi:2-phosphosulfolactate phosphatase
MENKTPLRIDVAILPTNAENFSSRDALAIVIDTLRFTTSAITAIEQGAGSVQTCTSVAAALAMRERDPSLLLCGERGGTRIDGFDLGNSPLEYTASRVAKRRLVFSTTNGTVAVEVARQAKVAEIVLGSLINRRAIAQHMFAFLDRFPMPAVSDPHHTQAAVTFVCAGTDGLVAGEDVLSAGGMLDAFLEILTAQGCDRERYLLSDSALIALTLWRHSVSDDHLGTNPEERVERFFQHVRGGAKLLELGFGADLKAASAIDSSHCVPIYATEPDRAALIEFTR